jgi:hypothetical protein
MDMADPSNEQELFDRDSLARIVTATKLPLCSDHKALQSDLVQCYRSWVLLSYFGRRPAKKGIERLMKLKEWAAEGVGLLKDHAHIDVLWAAHGQGCPPLLPQMKMLTALLEQMKLGRDEYDGSPLENLSGVLLPAVFKYHFKKEPKLSRDHDDGKAGGPYIRFAEQVCLQFGINCRPETIVSAMKRHRAKPVSK